MYKIEACETHEMAYADQRDYLVGIGKCAVLLNSPEAGWMCIMPPGDVAR